jgi:hypothetical protein
VVDDVSDAGAGDEAVVGVCACHGVDWDAQSGNESWSVFCGGLDHGLVSE